MNFKMRISISKTKVISSLEELICLIQDSDTLEDEVVSHVTNYKYLGGFRAKIDAIIIKPNLKFILF